jgi:Fe-S oxidoreductase
MVVNPKDQRYWDEQDLAAELNRVYDICHQCRMCFNLCPSFPELFKFIDEKDGDVKALTRVEMNRVNDLCYQCKICFVKCPYTAPHQWDLDFPRLLMRDKAVRTKKEGVSFQDRMLGDPDRSGKNGCRTASLANWANHNAFARKIMQKTLGIHEKRNLPDFQNETFEEWFRKRTNPLKSKKKIAFFHTCFVNYYGKQQGISVVEVLEKNEYEVIVPKQVCCGMPHLDGGEVEKATAKMEENVHNFRGVVDTGIPVLSLGPTCTYVLKNEVAFYTQDPAAEKLGKATKDICEFLAELKSKGELNREFTHTPPTRIAYQIPCHLKAQNIGYKSMEVLRAIPNVQVELMENCSAMDGTWGMKKQYYELSLKIARKLFREVENAAANEVCTDCPLSALQIEQGTGKRPLHPIQVLHRAYGL